MKHLGIDVVLEKVPMVPSAFSKDTLQSNRIWVGDKAIEEWLSGTAGSSKCCSTCGEADCRTLILEGKTYEAIPAELIIRACLIAGSELLGVESDKPCCPPAETSKTRDTTECCPPSQDRPK